MKTQRLGSLVGAAMTLAGLFIAAQSNPAQAATNLVTNTSDSGPGSLRAAIQAANLSVNVPDFIHFDIAGAGPHTITPLTPLPAVTDPVTIDGYTQSGASANTLASGDDAVLKIVVLESLIIDATNTTVRGLAIRQIQVGTVPGPKGSNVIEGCFVGLDTSGTNSLASPGFGVFVQTPTNRVGGTTPAARNLISGKGATGIEVFEIFAVGNVIQGNFIGTDRTGTKAIGNTDRALVVNQNASVTTIGGEVPGAGNVISGNLDRGITLDGSNNVVQGNFIGTDVTGLQPLGNARSGIEIGGGGNTVGGVRNGAANVIAFNGVNGGGFATTNGVDVKPGATFYAILGNSIFDNRGLGIDVNANGLVTPGFPVLTLVSNTTTATVIRGTHTPNVSFLLELFTNPTADPSGFGEGKTLLTSTNIATDGGGNFAINWPAPIAPGLFLTATANGNTEFSQARMVTAAGSTNSWTNSVSGKWENGPNWSLNVPPFSGHSLVLITNAGTKTVNNDATTASGFPSTLTISNLVISAPGGATNTLLLAHGGTGTPLRILRTLNVNSGGAMVINNAALNLEGPPSSFSRIDGALTLNDGLLTATNSSQLYIGSSGSGSLTVSNGTFRVYYPIVGINAGASGTWHIAGGTNIVTQVFDIGDSLTATGTVMMTGGLLTTPNIYIGLFGNGSLIVSNGNFQCAGQVDVASQPGAQGNFTATGGFCSLGSMVVSEGPGAAGSVLVAGNALVQVNGHVENRSGTVKMEGGTLIVSNLMMMNASGQFIFNRGTLQTHSSVVSNNSPFVVGDGVNSAVYQLLGGTNSFAQGLRIASSGALAGTGTITAPVSVFAGGTFSPGGSIGTLTIRSNLLLAGTTFIELNKQGGTNDRVQGMTSVNYGGTLVVTNIAGTLIPGDSFPLFSAASSSNNFGSIVNQTGIGGIAFSFNPTNGVLSVVSGGTASYPTNIVFSLSGSTLSLSWPATHLGWILQSQTNALNVGIQTNANAWFDWSGSSAVTSTNIPINPANPTVFFRLRHP